MRFAFSDEQLALKREARRVLEKAPDWAQIVALGWPGLAIPEQYGGAGLGWVELCAVLEEAGRVLLAAPLLSSCIAAQALVEHGTEAQRQEYLPRLAEGQRATLVLDNGLALDGMDAELFVFSEHVSTRVERVSVEPLDATRPLARISGKGAPFGLADRGKFPRARSSGVVGGAGGRRPNAAWRWRSSTPRRGMQFGRPIGSFQAIKHKCADMLVSVESGKSAAYFAAWAAADADEELPLAARWRRRTARRRTSTPPPRTSRSTEASASPGSIRRI